MEFKPILATGAVILTCVYGAGVTAAGEVKKQRSLPPARLTSENHGTQTKIAEIRRRLLERKMASRDALKRLLADKEKKLARQSADYEAKQRDYQRNLASRADLTASAQAVSRTRGEIERLRQWIAEDDAALALAGYVRREQQEPVSDDPRGGILVTSAFIRYNGPADWSLEDAGKIGKFFFDHFGHALPISAMGQSVTHDRMGLDHHDAMDVAIQPDSAEGRALMAYLREAGIPFIAFRNRIRGMATGAHIHIGRPSLKLIHVRQLLMVSPHDEG
jgi:hypothetical protein